VKRARLWKILALLLAGAAVAVWMIRLRPPQNARALLALLPPDAEAYAVMDLQVLQSNPRPSRRTTNNSWTRPASVTRIISGSSPRPSSAPTG
jgi:hypothetical protein